MIREPKTQYVASISYGKDSLAMLEAIKILGYPLDRIVTAEVWATDDIQADLPPMVEFKDKADKIIKERYGIQVEHFHSKDKDGNKLTYEKIFYRTRKQKEKKNNVLYGFPSTIGAWCNSKLKVATLNDATKSIRGGYYKDLRISNDERKLVQHSIEDASNKFSLRPVEGITNTIQYVGIASDESERIERHKKNPNVIMPLVDIGWEESFCRKWCEENDLLSPIYAKSMRGGCWFCHNQGVDQLRQLRHDYPNLWELLMKWDLDSPVTFHADGRTIHDFDKRFQLEDDGIVKPSMNFRWNFLDGEIQTRLF